MIKVYMESSAHAELVAVFKDEKTYDSCIQALEGLAKKRRMILTENVIGDEEIDTVQGSDLN